jgi:hypothetical protein
MEKWCTIFENLPPLLVQRYNVNAAPKQASFQINSRPHHHAISQAKSLYVKCTLLNTNLRNKKNKKRVALATNYLDFSKCGQLRYPGK